eukprot:10111953-Karenia_brevis.AAC.1
MARMENVIDKMAISLTDVVQASIDIRASTFIKTQDLRQEIDKIKNENPDVPAWRNLQLTLSKQSDDMLARLTSANDLLHERVARLINGKVLQHKTATADLQSRIKEVETVLQQWE